MKVSLREVYECASDELVRVITDMEALKPGSEELEIQAKVAKSLMDSCVNAVDTIERLDLEAEKNENDNRNQVERLKLDGEKNLIDIQTQEKIAQNELKAKYIELGVTSAIAVSQLIIGVWAFSFANVFEINDTYSKQTSKQIVTKMIDLMKTRK